MKNKLNQPIEEKETTFCTHLGYNTVAPCGEDCPTNQPIEEKWKIEGEIVGITERIVIEYANFSGRETAHRAEFRKRVEEILTPFIENLLEQERKRMSDEIEEMKTYTGGSSVEEKHKRVNKQEVMSIINK